MNKLTNVLLAAIVILLCLGGYWFLNPHELPRFLRDSLPDVQVPSPKSPMSNFRPPQF